MNIWLAIVPFYVCMKTEINFIIQRSNINELNKYLVWKLVLLKYVIILKYM